MVVSHLVVVGMELGTLEEQSVTLTTELSLQPRLTASYLALTLSSVSSATSHNAASSLHTADISWETGRYRRVNEIQPVTVLRTLQRCGKDL